jgi:DNA-binding SARP family transcriptional activator
MATDRTSFSPRPTPPPAPDGGKLEIRLLGSFDLHKNGEPVAGIESQSARALLAYLVCHPGRAIPREVLTHLLWPDAAEARARHNLRQSLYNLRSTLGRNGIAEPLIVTTFRTMKFEPGDSVWVDVLACREHLERGRGNPDGIVPHHLAKAAQLYRGDFLSGFYLRDSATFEEWMVAEQERHRDVMLAGLRSLMEHYTLTGAYSLAIQYAQTFLRLDRFSEEIHRELMGLFARAGRRSRAVAHYHELTRLLEGELGVPPARETRELYRQIQEAGTDEPVSAREEPAPRPVAPLVGRERELAELSRTWDAVRSGAGALTLVAGEAGVGKTRLVRAFLDRAAAQTPSVRVLIGRCHTRSPAEPYQPFAEALHNAVACETDVAERVLGSLGKRHLEALSVLVPTLAQIAPQALWDRTRPDPTAGSSYAGALSSAVGRFLELLAERGDRETPATPLIVLLEDLHWADSATLDLLLALLPRLVFQPIWILGTFEPERRGEDDALAALADRYPGRCPIHRLSVDRLVAADLSDLAGSLVAGTQIEALGNWLFEQSGGLPLAATQLLNALWNEDLLVAQPGGRWTFETDGEGLARFDHHDLDTVIKRRLSRLPTSARRMLALASVIGPTFEAWVLQSAEQEDDRVLETTLQVLCEQWFIQPFQRYWADSRRDRDRAASAAGLRFGMFEFVHEKIRSVVYDTLGGARARQLHLQRAESLLASDEGPTAQLSAALAHHFQRAGAHESACLWLERAAAHALDLEAVDLARAHFEAALTELDRRGDEISAAGLRERIADALAAGT